MTRPDSAQRVSPVPAQGQECQTLSTGRARWYPHPGAHLIPGVPVQLCPGLTWASLRSVWALAAGSGSFSASRRESCR